MQNIDLKQPIFSFTLKELYDNRDGDFIHHDKYTSELDSPVLEYAYANTLKFRIKSSHFGETVKMKDGRTGTNQTWYHVFVLFEDFYTIGKDVDIGFEDAIDYAITYGDVHIRCNCPAQSFWGYNFIDTELKALYGIPLERRFPKIRNPNLKGVMCKHIDAVIQWIFRNKETIAKMFALYYNRLNDGQSIYAVNPLGNTITIGKKNDDGDIFFERQQEEDEIMEKTEETLEEVNKAGPEEEDNVSEGEVMETPDDWWENPEETEDL